MDSKQFYFFNVILTRTKRNDTHKNKKIIQKMFLKHITNIKEMSLFKTVYIYELRILY